MKHSLDIEHQRRLIETLKEQIVRRVDAEEEAASQRAALFTLEKGDDGARLALESRFEQERASLEQEQAATLASLEEEFESKSSRIEARFRRAATSIQRGFEERLQDSVRRRDDAQWMVSSYYDDSVQDGPKQQYELFKDRVRRAKAHFSAEFEDLETRRAELKRLLISRRVWNHLDTPKADVHAADLDAASRGFSEAALRFREEFSRLKRQKLPQMFVGWRPFVLFIICWIALGSGLLSAREYASGLGLTVGSAAYWNSLAAGFGFCSTVLALTVAYAFAASQSSRVHASIVQQWANAKAAHRRWKEIARVERETKKREFQRWHAAIMQKQQEGLGQADDGYALELAELTEQRDIELKQANRHLKPLAEVTATYDEQREQAAEFHRQQWESIEVRHNRELQQHQEQHTRHIEECRQSLDEKWTVLSTAWFSALADFKAGADEMHELGRTRFPDWPEFAAKESAFSDAVPAHVRIGWHELNLESIEDAIPGDTRLVPEQTHFQLPAVLPFETQPSLLIKADARSRGKAVDALRTVMLRLLTCLPPGKLRFTVIDPVGLGESFSSFMNLADYDEQLITSRIWTEAAHIEQQLADLTEHMENVFQTYLRNEFETIDEYNKHADEVAEPYRVLVVSDFPARFTEQAARRLTSIITSGPRCGVITLISVDPRHPLPTGFDMSVLEQNANVLLLKNDRFESRDLEITPLPVSLDEPPASALFNELVHRQGSLAKNARRVEVPFERIAPAADQLWTGDTRSGIDVALGRAGATKHQHMRLGRGTSQHVLVAGKTGSGKSTLLHVLITNVALHYSPDELELYLVDFKKGVEFKAYAVAGLPHARVIGIESDREFGLSVLESLDGVLKQRGELFREQAVSDLAAYRNACPDSKMPRILLVIDEFHEFFVEDDRIAQTASLLLDRLVRQGRAFGIHVILGSQTLGGAYSLARSTLGQMAVRVALQCSESDAHLILSEDNTAARLLNRPGEAIYNDANGRLDGNHPFQVAWLSDETRDDYLGRIQAIARERKLPPSAPIVFEGNVPAEPASNAALVRLVESSEPAAMFADELPHAWLGEAVSIKDPTEVHFGRHSGSNMLIVGQNPDSALGIMANSLIALAAQNRTLPTIADEHAPCFYVFTDRSANARETDEWQQLADAMPQQVRVVGTRGVKRAIAELSALADAREEADEALTKPVFVLVYNLGRFRDLRRDEDDFGFSTGKDEAARSPSRQFGDLLRNGPAVGIHTIAWCDSYNNVNRWLGNQLLREMEMRVVFQLGPADSSNLIDSPLASKLGTNRGLLYREDDGTTEKFRPYRPPSEMWRAWIHTQFAKGIADNGSAASSISGAEIR